jgi:hypothetical protein
MGRGATGPFQNEMYVLGQMSAGLLRRNPLGTADPLSPTPPQVSNPRQSVEEERPLGGCKQSRDGKRASRARQSDLPSGPVAKLLNARLPEEPQQLNGVSCESPEVRWADKPRVRRGTKLKVWKIVHQAASGVRPRARKRHTPATYFHVTCNVSLPDAFLYSAYIDRQSLARI